MHTTARRRRTIPGRDRRSRRAPLILGAAALVSALTACDLAGVSRVSSDPAAPSAPIEPWAGDMSDDGAIVVFVSEHAFDAADTNGVDDVIVSDRETGFRGRASYALGGGAPNAKAKDPAVSGNGRYVTWSSTATDIVPGDTNGVEDVFRLDLDTGTTVRVSVSSTGAQVSANSGDASMSDDGRYVVFASYATDLVPNDTNDKIDTFVRDVDAGTTTRWSVDADGDQMPGHSTYGAISGDGRWVAFSTAEPFDPADTNGRTDVYLKNGGGRITRVSHVAGRPQSDGSSIRPTVNDDGSVVAFQSLSSTFVDHDENGEHDVYVWEAGTLELVSADRNGRAGSGEASSPSLDGSGNLVGFTTSSPELNGGSTRNQSLVRNRSEGHLDLVSASLTGEPGLYGDHLEAISGDGRSVLMWSTSPNINPDPPIYGGDMLVKAYPFPRITRVTPDVLTPGTTTTVTIEGKGFSGPMYVSLSANPGAAVTTGGTISVSPNRVQVNVTVPPGAAVHVHDVKVQNLSDHPDNSGAETTCYDCLSVTVT